MVAALSGGRTMRAPFVLPLALLALTGCAHEAVAATRIHAPERSTAWSLSVTPLGNRTGLLEDAIARSFEENFDLVRSDRAHAEAHVDLTVSTTGVPLVDEFCQADVHAVVYPRGGGRPIFDEETLLDDRCGWHGNAIESLLSQAVGWALEHAVARLAAQ